MNRYARMSFIFAVAAPIIVQNVINHLQVVIDRAFLGRLNPEYLSSIGNVMTPFNAVCMFILSVATGLTVLISQKIGSRDPEKAGEYAEASFVYSTIFSTVIFLIWMLLADPILSALGATGSIKEGAFHYVRILSFTLIFLGIDATSAAILQGVGYTRPIMYAGIIKTALNIFLDWALIFGHAGLPAMGIEGAALATVIANLAGTVFLTMVALKWRGLPFHYTRRAILRPSWSEYWETMRMGLPTGFESLLWFAGQILIIRMLNMSDPLFVGITSLVGSVQIFALFVYLGFSRAGMILVGRHWGEGNRAEAVRTGLLCQKMSLAVSIAWGLVLFFFGAGIATIFTDKVEIIAASGFVMKIAAFSISFQALNVTAGAAIRGTGDTHWMLYSQIFGTIFVILVSYLLIVRYDWGLTGMYLTVAADELIRGVFNLARFVSGVNPLRLALRNRADAQ